MRDRPAISLWPTASDSMVWPMVPQGVSNSYVQYARDHSPTWDDEE